MRDINSFNDAASYLNKKGIDYNKILPLIFLADKYHLMCYSRKITPVNYFFKTKLFSDVLFEIKETQYLFLSVSDKESLDLMYNYFNKKSEEEIYLFLKSFLKEGHLSDDDLFFYIEEEPFLFIPKEAVTLSKELKLERDQIFEDWDNMLSQVKKKG